MTQNIPEIEFCINTNGIIIYSRHLNIPRFLPFNTVGCCNHCKGHNVQFDYALHEEGIIVYCSRIKNDVSIMFDCFPLIFNEGAFVRVTSRLRTFNIPLMGKHMWIPIPGKGGLSKWAEVQDDIPLDVQTITNISKPPIDLAETLQEETYNDELRTEEFEENDPIDSYYKCLSL